MHQHLAILTYNGVALFEMSCGVELFGLPRPEFDAWYQCDLVTLEKKTVHSTMGVQINSTVVENFDDYDLLIIPSWPTDQSDIPEALKESLIKFYHSGKRLISFCSGAFLLAELGILDQQKATTHWRYAEKFQTRYPLVHYVDNVLYVYDGHIGCSAGSAAAIDLGLEVIREDFGYHIANQVARRLVLSAHRKGGQSQFAETPVLHSKTTLHHAVDWALDHLHQTINIDTLAQKSNMSRRNFDRKFRASFNTTPKTWLTLQRLHLAKSLLENNHYSIEKIAEQSGFENANLMRHHFRKEFGISPTEYQSQFTNKTQKI